MKAENLLDLLEYWLKFESCVDTDGYISPSKTAIDATHYHFIKNNKFTRMIASIKIDQQGGILVNMHQNSKENFKVIMHILFDGVIDYFRVYDNKEVQRERLFLNENKHGFGTDKYKFD